MIKVLVELTLDEVKDLMYCIDGELGNARTLTREYVYHLKTIQESLSHLLNTAALEEWRDGLTD